MKFQITNNKSQINLKFQIQNIWDFEPCNLFGAWNLVLGAL
jgi:hypothetical protein